MKHKVETFEKRKKVAEKIEKRFNKINKTLSSIFRSMKKYDVDFTNASISSLPNFFTLSRLIEKHYYQERGRK